MAMMARKFQEIQKARASRTAEMTKKQEENWKGHAQRVGMLE